MVDATSAAEPGGDAQSPPTLREVVSPLLELEGPRQFGAAHLVCALRCLEHAQEQLKTRKPPEEEALSDQDGILLAWLAGVYHALSASQALLHGDLLQPQLVASGIVAPFVQPGAPSKGPDGNPIGPPTAARFGVPSTTEVLCDSASELLRAAAAALLGLHVYLNFRQGPGDLPADEVTLVFATLGIRSCMDAGNAAAVDAQLRALIDAEVSQHGAASLWQQLQAQQPPGSDGGDGGSAPDSSRPPFGCAEIRWLLHYIRGMVSHYCAAVAHVLEKKEEQAQYYHAQQKDMQLMVKALPRHPLGFSLFARCAMNGQQMSLAAAFLAQGLAIARKVSCDSAVAAMAFQRAAALLLGGGGSGAAVDAAEVQALLEEGEAARASVRAWFPAPWAAAAEDGEPDRSLVLRKLLPELERRHGAPLPAEGSVDALTGLLYVTRPPASIPAGAVQHVVAGGHEAVEEGQEEEEEEGT